MGANERILLLIQLLAFWVSPVLAGVGGDIVVVVVAVPILCITLAVTSATVSAAISIFFSCSYALILWVNVKSKACCNKVLLCRNIELALAGDFCKRCALVRALHSHTGCVHCFA